MKHCSLFLSWWTPFSVLHHKRKFSESLSWLSEGLMLLLGEHQISPIALKILKPLKMVDKPS